MEGVRVLIGVFFAGSGGVIGEGRGDVQMALKISQIPEFETDPLSFACVESQKKRGLSWLSRNLVDPSIQIFWSIVNHMQQKKKNTPPFAGSFYGRVFKLRLSANSMQCFCSKISKKSNFYAEAAPLDPSVLGGL